MLLGSILGFLDRIQHTLDRRDLDEIDDHRVFLFSRKGEEGSVPILRCRLMQRGRTYLLRLHVHNLGSVEGSRREQQGTLSVRTARLPEIDWRSAAQLLLHSLRVAWNGIVVKLDLADLRELHIRRSLAHDRSSDVVETFACRKESHLILRIRGRFSAGMMEDTEKEDISERRSDGGPQR